MSIEIIDILKPKNGLSFKLIEDVDIAVQGYESLADAVSHFVTQSAVQQIINAALSGKQDTLSSAQLAACNSGITAQLVTQISTNTTSIAGKASQADLLSSTASLQAQIDAIVTPVTQDAEVEAARVGSDGTSYASLKSRLDAEDNAIKEDLTGVEEFITANSNEINPFYFSTLNSRSVVMSFDEDGYLTITGTADSAGWIRTDAKMYLTAGDWYIKVTNYSGVKCTLYFYDESDQQVGQLSQNSYQNVFTAATDGYYNIRTYVGLNDAFNFEGAVMLSKGSAADFVKHHYELKVNDDVANLQNEIDTFDQRMYADSGERTAVQTTYVDGVLENDGTVTASQYAKTSGFITVNSQKNYYVSCAVYVSRNTNHVQFYDSNQVLIGGAFNGNTDLQDVPTENNIKICINRKIIFPQGTAYFRFSTYTQPLSTYGATNCNRQPIEDVVNDLEYEQQKEYVVNLNGDGDFTSFTDCLYALQNDTSPKIIYVDGGEYDIYEELGGDQAIADITDPTQVNWREVNPVVSENTTIIGRGYVLLKYMPAPEKIGSMEMSQLFSPLNVSASCTIKNINIECQNCRYGIHAEGSSLSIYDKVETYFENVNIDYKASTYGTGRAFASGYNREYYVQLTNCDFKSEQYNAFWLHENNQSTKYDGGILRFDNCVLAAASTATTALQLTSQDTVGRISNVYLNNCYLSGKLTVSSSSGGTKDNFKIRTLGCNEITYNYDNIEEINGHIDYNVIS